ncbi:MAG: thioredoxin [Paludibacteraceae bacterium]|nr:thioredoxin [Paludibacteraceae bacterium]MBR4839474.1 thioredoxin [Paludibacteraceae bacterium]
MALEVTDSNFEELAKDNDVLVIDLWAEWCGPCRALSPVIEDLSRQYAGKVAIGKVDVDANPDICKKFGIRNVPTLLFIKKGELAEKTVGALPKNTIASKIDALI